MAGGDVVALVVDDGVEPVGERVDEAVDVGDLGGLEDLGVGGVGVAVAEVLPDRVSEQPGVLEHHAELRPQLPAGDGRDVVPVEGDPASVELVEPQQQVDQRRLAGPGRSDDGHRLARLGGEVEPGDQGLVGISCCEPAGWGGSVTAFDDLEQLARSGVNDLG